MSPPASVKFGAFILFVAALSACAPADLTNPTAQTGVEVGGTYLRHGTEITLSAALPTGPAEAGIFLAQPARSASIESARALAERFGMTVQSRAPPATPPITQAS